MRLWDTSKLADDIVGDQISPKEKLAYYVLAQVFYSAVGYAALYGLSSRSWLFVYEAVVVCVIVFAGANRVASLYPRPLDGSFFETAYLLAIPLSIKATLAIWLLIYGWWWAVSTIVPKLSIEGPAIAITYWLNRGWELVPFLVVVIVSIVFWQRLARHVQQVATRRGA
jgi:hypothetical protein